MKKLKCYYAHTILSYGSTQEEMDIKLLERLGFEVINPNTPEIENELEQFIIDHGKRRTMDFFTDIVSDCDLLAFRALPNSEILSGVAVEIMYARDHDMPIIELPCSLDSRVLNYPETKQFLIEIGHYKSNK